MAEQKNRHAVALGRKGGLARSKALSPADKKLAAQRAAQARWSRHHADLKRVRTAGALPWVKTPFGWTVCVSTTHESPGLVRWTVRRAPSFRVERGRVTRRYWLYRASPPEEAGLRYSPTGRWDDSLGFSTAKAAKAYVERLYWPGGPSGPSKSAL